MISGTPIPARYGVSVPALEALDILRKHDAIAAAWLWEHTHVAFNSHFGFGEDEVEIVRGVTRVQIREVPEEAMGNPDR
jgi:hypothetical protein